AEDGIRDFHVTGVQTCALPISTPKQRPPKLSPPRKLSLEERQKVLEIVHEPRFIDLAPAAVYHQLLDQALYLCSVSTMYRILREIGRASCSEIVSRTTVAVAEI